MDFNNLLQLFQSLANRVGPGQSGNNYSNGRGLFAPTPPAPSAIPTADTTPPNSDEALANTKKWLAKHNSSDVQAVHHAAIQHLGRIVTQQQQQISALQQAHAANLQAVQGIQQKLTQPQQPAAKPLSPAARTMAPFQGQ